MQSAKPKKKNKKTKNIFLSAQLRTETTRFQDFQLSSSNRKCIFVSEGERQKKPHNCLLHAHTYTRKKIVVESVTRIQSGDEC